MKCELKDIAFMVDDFSHFITGGNYIRCELSTKFYDRVVIIGVGKGVTHRKIPNVPIIRGHPIENPPLVGYEEAILKEIYALFSIVNMMKP